MLLRLGNDRRPGQSHGLAGIPDAVHLAWVIPLLLLVTGLFCAVLNFGIDWLIYQPLRSAPKLAPLVSAIGVSFVLLNIGLLWGGSRDFSVTDLVTKDQLGGDDSFLKIRVRDLIVVGTVLPVMGALIWLVHHTKLGKAMRAIQQNPTAAQLMGIPVQRIIGATFALGGALAGAAAVVYVLTEGTNSYQMGYKYGLYAFTAAVVGGIGNIRGTVLGSLVIGFVKSFSEGYLSAEWSNTLIFGMLVVILVFRPTGLLGQTQREKV